MNTEFKKNRHSIYNLTYHLVVITKYRRKCINEDIKELKTKKIAPIHPLLIEEKVFSGHFDKF